jgi:hypothetical protein
MDFTVRIGQIINTNLLPEQANINKTIPRINPNIFNGKMNSLLKKMNKIIQIYQI